MNTPPQLNPSEEPIEHAIAEGILDRAALEALPTMAELAQIPREPSPPGTRLGSEAIRALRDEETR